MLIRLYTSLGRAWPWFRKSTKRLMYQFMAGYDQGRDWTFMNYGYAPLDAGASPIPLSPADEPNRYCIQLYHHVAGAVRLSGRRVLEVGSGRGGGADYVKRYLEPRTLIGLDFSSRAVALCNRHHGREGLTFIAGDAESLPFGEGSFDAVISVESAHCYRSLEAFLAQVRHVLCAGGHLLFADFCPQGQLEGWKARLHRSGLRVLARTDITPNVVEALDADHARRVAQIRQGAPRPLVRLMQQFAGTRGTRIYEQFRRRDMVYHSLVLQKA